MIYGTHRLPVPRHIRQLVTILMMLGAMIISHGVWAVEQPPVEQAVADQSAANTADDGDSPANNAATADPAAYAALLAILENNDTREQFLADLRRLSGEQDAPDMAQRKLPASSSTPAPAYRHTQTPASGVTERLQAFASKVRHDISGSWQVLSGLMAGSHVYGVTLSKWTPALNSLLAAIIAVAVAYLTLRLVARYGFKRLDTWIMREPARVDVTSRGARRLAKYTHGRKLLAVIVALLLDVGASLLAGMAGYAAVIAVTSGSAASLFAMQFLTAFVSVEAVKAVSRGVFATRYDRLRLLPISSETAHYWNRWLAIIISITGYSLLLIVPVTQTLLTPSVGHILGLLLMLAVYLYAVRVVWNKRHVVRDGLVRQAERSNAPVFGTLTRILARIWHWLVLVYFTVLFIVSQTDQQDALGFMGAATAQSVIAVLIGAALIMGVTSLATRHIHLPAHWNQGLPSLETRLNAYVPTFLRGLRLLIAIVVALIVLDAWRAFNLAVWLSSPGGQTAISTIIHVGIILVIAAMSWTVLASVIEHRLGVSGGRRRPSEREKTLLMLFRNAAAVTIATMTVLVVLSQIGIDIGPLIAGAGVAGLAIGFGAQKLVQDVITGVFIQLENGMNQNDIVEIVGLFGTVEKITIRSVVVRTLDGGYHLIPFSAIDKVSNHTRDYGYHYAEYNIAHRENVAHAIAQLELAFKALMQDPEIAPEVLEDISIPGVTALNEHGFTLRVMIKTTPGNQWAVQRAFNRLVKDYFDAAGIELPYPQTVVHFGRDRDGKAAPVDLRHVEKLGDAFDVGSAPGQTLRPAPGLAGAQALPES